MSDQSQAKATAAISDLKSVIVKACDAYQKLVDEANNTAGDGLTGDQTETFIKGVETLTQTIRTAFTQETPGPIVLPPIDPIPGPFGPAGSAAGSRTSPPPRNASGVDPNIDPKSGLRR